MRPGNTVERRLRSFAACTLATFALSGCRGDAIGPEVFDPVGTLSFSYAGGGGVVGSFTATGALDPAAAELAAETGARAFSDGRIVTLVATRTRAAGRADLFMLMLGEVGSTGRLTLDPLACGEPETCRIGFFLPDVDPATLEQDLDWLLENAYFLVFGEVNITHVSSLRLRGTFNAAGLRGTAVGTDTSITLSNGSFDLPLQTE